MVGRVGNSGQIDQRHSRISRALISKVVEGLPSEPNHYMQRHLAEHVAAAYCWRALADHPDVLDRLDPDSVAAVVLSHAFGRPDVDLPPEIAAVAMARHRLAPLCPADRTLSREVAMAQLGFGPMPLTSSVQQRPGEVHLTWAALGGCCA